MASSDWFIYMLYRYLMVMEDLRQQPMLEEMRSDSFLKMLISRKHLKLLMHL